MKELEEILEAIALTKNPNFRESIRHESLIRQQFNTSMRMMRIIKTDLHIWAPIKTVLNQYFLQKINNNLTIVFTKLHASCKVWTLNIMILIYVFVLIAHAEGIFVNFMLLSLTYPRKLSIRKTILRRLQSKIKLTSANSMTDLVALT